MDANALLKKKWKLIKPRGSNGYCYIIDRNVRCACKLDATVCSCEAANDHLTVYTKAGKKVARHIIKLHNNYIDNLKKEK